MKRIIILLTAFAIVCSCLAFNASAASTTIAFSSKNPKVNDTVTVTVNVQSSGAMYSTEFNVTYNPDVLQFVSGDSANGGAGSVKVVGAVSGGTKQSYSLKFTAIAAGPCTVAASGGAFLSDNEEAVSASAVLNVSDATKSDNANLKSLRVSAGSLSPKFSPSVTSYTVNVKKNITECKVYAEPAEGENAKVSITGSSALEIGNNTRVLTVTAPSGTQKEYTLTIVRSDVDEEESSETSSTTETAASLETVIDGVSYMVLKDISGVELPVGFNAVKRLYNNEEISVAVDSKENFELFYLKATDSEMAFPYIYDSEKNAFKKVQMLSQGSNNYIITELPKSLTVPEEYITKTVTIQDMSVTVFISSDEALKEMYYIYCYFGGDYNMYRYDSVENVLQRCPEFKLISAEAKETLTSNIEFINRFNTLSTNAKTIVVCLLIAFVGVIALIVLLIIKFVKRGSFEDFDLEDEDDFDSVRFDENFEIIPEDKQND